MSHIDRVANFQFAIRLDRELRPIFSERTLDSKQEQGGAQYSNLIRVTKALSSLKVTEYFDWN